MTALVKKTAVREAAGNLNVGADFYSALDRRVREMVERAAERASENGRKTVKARDA